MFLCTVANRKKHALRKVLYIKGGGSFKTTREIETMWKLRTRVLSYIPYSAN